MQPMKRFTALTGFFAFHGWLFIAATWGAEPLMRYQQTQRHMGSEISITLYAPTDARATAAFQAGFAQFAAIDKVGSDYNPDSELSLLSRAAPSSKPIPVSETLWPLLSAAEKYAQASHGAFDITVGPLTKLWRRARRQKEMPTDEELANALAAVSWKNLVLDESTRTAALLKPNMRLDLGGIAQGYAADKAVAAMKTLGITRVLVDASGDVALGDPPPGETAWRVGLSPVAGEGMAERIVSVANMAVVSSGDAYQAVTIQGKRYSHIVDPKTGLGLTGRSQVTVIAPDATSADALATALCVLGPEQGFKLLEKYPNTHARIVSQADDNSLVERESPHFSQWYAPTKP
jgi:FAD:protein FMN transferase